MQYPVKFVKNFIVKQFMNSTHNILILREKANMWHGRGNSGGSWPAAIPRSQEVVGGIFLIFSSSVERKEMVVMYLITCILQ